MTDIQIETEDETVVRSDGDLEVVIPAPGIVSVFTRSADSDEVTEHLVAGWNAVGAPIVVGKDAGLELLDADRVVTDLSW